MAACKSCGTAIEWRRSTNTGKLAPFDAEPSDDGNVRFFADRATILSRLEADQARVAGERLHKSHFATCPDAATYRKRAASA